MAEIKGYKQINTITNEIVSEALHLLQNNVYKIVLYGSYARGDFTSESDIDIMILLNCRKEQVMQYRKQISQLSSRIGLKNDIEISLLLRDRDTFERGEYVLPFYKKRKTELKYMDKELWSLSQYRIEQAERCIRSAKVLVEDEDYKGSANRSYYAIFHCMRSILALDNMK